MSSPTCISAAEVAHDLSGRARVALAHGNGEGAAALASVAHTYALIAEAAIPSPRQETAPTERWPQPLPEPRTTSTPEPGTEPTPEPGADTQPEPPQADPSSAVPPLLVQAHQAVVRAGGTMYTSDLAAALGVGTQQLGTELTKILRSAGVTRPKNGSVSPARGRPFRTGFTAETLATAIVTYRIRAELSTV